MTSTLDWYGCPTFRLRTAGLTVFLDAYIEPVRRALRERAPGVELLEPPYLAAPPLFEGLDRRPR